MSDSELDGFFNKLQEKAKATPAEPRRTAKVFQSSVTAPSVLDFDTSMQKALSAFEKARDALVSRQQRRYENRKQVRMTKKQLTEKVRSEIKTGKLPKGSLGKTVDKRWKANQARHERSDKKFQTELDKKVDDLKKLFFPDGGPAQEFQVLLDKWRYTVEATVAISEDSRTINVSFKANTGDDLDAQVFLACADYFQDDRIDVEDWTITSQEALENDDDIADGAGA